MHAGGEDGEIALVVSLGFARNDDGCQFFDFQ